MMNELKTFIYNMVKRALVRLPINDATDFQVMQVSYMGKTADIENILPYGLCSSPPIDSLSLVFTVNAQEENRAGITNSPRLRFKNLKEGEVAVGNYLTGSVVKFLEDGNIEVTSANGLVVTVAGDSTVTVGGDANVTVTGTTTLTSTGNVSITAPLTTVNGPLTVTGTLTTANGTIGASGSALSGTMTNNGVNVGSTHIHSQGDDSNGDTEVDTGVPM